MPPNRTPYQGGCRKVILAFDVGTTNSGISYCILEPGLVPEVRSVTRYPAQTQSGQDCKIPSIVYYDREGHARAFGAEALQEEVQYEAEANSWMLAEWFKLYLPTGNLNRLQEAEPNQQPLPRIPPNKTPMEIFADFIRYLYGWAKIHISQIHGDDGYWNIIEGTTEFVITHPNGWEGVDQMKLRMVACQAGLVPNTTRGHTRVHFVTEGEACLHHCIHNLAQSYPDIQSMKNVMIIDAGGGTIDFSTYSTIHRAKLSPNACFEEVAVPQTRLAGSVFVTKAFERHVKARLPDNHQNDVVNIVREFDRTTKLRFTDASQTSFVRFGGWNDHEPALNINHGKLLVSGDDMRLFFEESVQSIMTTAEQQIQAAYDDFNKPIEESLHRADSFVAFLVGGFATNEWLYSNLKTHLEQLGVLLLRPETYVNKATANGAIDYFLDNFVSVRMSRYTYGIEFERTYEPGNQEHRPRRHTRYRALSGWQFTRVKENECYSVSFDRESETREELKVVPVEILVYQGQTQDPQWMDDEPGKFRVLAKIHADTSELARSLKPLTSPRGRYFQVEFDVVLIFGLTELKAEIQWLEKGRMKRTPAHIIYET
ncbi:hypothetical protein VNI00_002669 [Paramarasmius palmivorus]|uniref:Uncharacterized protein n=1 Tax=Paramarasmius palmivorus TaxID=297713 RepID=A0AAW0DVY3_9AGAR